jgi:hypothetical protein
MGRVAHLLQAKVLLGLCLPLLQSLLCLLLSVQVPGRLWGVSDMRRGPAQARASVLEVVLQCHIEVERLGALLEAHPHKHVLPCPLSHRSAPLLRARGQQRRTVLIL